MAVRFAIASGNWSNTAIWDNGALPLAADDVYANSYTVTIDQNVTVNTLRNDTLNIYVPNIATPAMTGNNTPSGLVTTSSGGTPWVAFDQNTATAWASGSINAAWVAYTFPSSKVIKRYALRTSNTSIRTPRTWTFEGSNDGSVWTVLDTQTNLSLSINSWYNYPIANVTAYTWYRVNITAANTAGNTLELGEIQMTESTSAGIGAGVNGGFSMNNGVAVQVGSLVHSASAVTLITYAGASPGASSLTSTGTLSISGGNATLIAHTSTGTLTVTGNIAFSTNNSGTNCINKTGAGILNYIGNITITSSVNNTNAGISCSAGTVNITGNLLNTGSFANGNALSFTGVATATVNGNVTAAGASTVINSTVAHTLTINGTITSTGTFPAVSSSSTTATNIFSGPLINNGNVTPVHVWKMFLTASPTYWRMQSVARTMYTTNYAPDFPLMSDVRLGTSYNSGLMTGTMPVPDPGLVTFGIPVGTTTGTALFSPTAVISEVWGALSTSLTTPNSIGVRAKNTITASALGAQLAAF